jgi:hypothetical protein
MRIGLLPLDERPVNTHYPAMIARIAGVDLDMPPAEMLSSYRQPARLERLIRWLEEMSPHHQALIASFEMLGYGGLIAARTSHDPPGEVLARLDVLNRLHQKFPQFETIGFNLIMRISNADSAVEEPEYWAREGRRFYQFSQLTHRAELGEDVGTELAKLRAELPEAHIQDFLQRRIRNHAVNLAALQMLANGHIHSLVLSSDDTSRYGLGSSEKNTLVTWADRLGLGEGLLMYPGADEVGCALLARVFNRAAGKQPSFQVVYGMPGGDKITAPYEDGPVAVTIERQIRAVGGRMVNQNADLFLAVNPPVPRRSEWSPEFADEERNARLPFLRQMVDEIRWRVVSGQAVVVADVAYPNGADPLLIHLLMERVDLTRLAAYGAWNTAGNTIGTALAQGCAALLVRSDAQKQAQQRFLVHRFLEDWGYQQVVRRETGEWLLNTFGKDEPDPQTEPSVIEHIFQGLSDCLSQLPGFGTNWRIVPGSVRLPWKRLFEVDFELETQGD